MNPDRSAFKPLAVSREIIVQELPEELLVYKTKIHRAMSLNKTVAAVWQNCNGKNSTVRLAQLLSEKFKTVVSEEVVLLALETLNENGLLVGQDEIQQLNFTGDVSRREVIRRAALSTAVALPVIAALTAPQAARAASNPNNPNLLADGSPCALDGQCLSGCCNAGFCDAAVACTV